MSVMRARTGRLIAAPTPRSPSASSRARSMVGMKAPLPTFTSITSACAPDATFLLRMDWRR